MTAALPGRSTFTVLLQWHLKSLVFCLAFGFTSLPPSCWRFTIVRPHLEYCSHVWASATECHLELPNKIQRRATRLVGDVNFTSQLAPLDAHCRVASLSLFYSYFHGHCANSVAELMPRPADISHLLAHPIAALGTLIECTCIVHALIPHITLL